MYGRQFLGNCLPAKSQSGSPALATIDVVHSFNVIVIGKDHIVYINMTLLRAFEQFGCSTSSLNVLPRLIVSLISKEIGKDLRC